MSNGRCYMHGGKHPRGIASPHLKHGRYSKDIPTRLAARYHEALTDPELLSLREDIALVHSVITCLLSEAQGGDVHPAWIEVKQWYEALNEAIAGDNEPKLIKAISELGRVIEPNYQARLALDEALSQIDRKSQLTDKERRALIDRQKVISIERVMLFVGVVMAGLKESVLKHTDNETARRILGETQQFYDQVVNLESPNHPSPLT